MNPPLNHVEGVSELSFLTYNVWRDNHPKNQDKLVEYIATSDSDVILLQEVTRVFYEKLLNLPIMRNEYNFVCPPAFVDGKGHHDAELLLVKKKFKATLYNHVLLERTGDQRHFACGFIKVNGMRLGVGTAHLESKFFTSEATTIKGSQLKGICKIIDWMKSDCFIFGGDCNLTGGSQLKAENAYIEQLKLIDVWKYFNETSELYEDEKYQKNDITWDGANNPNIRHKEFHRPDRIFLKSTTDRVIPLSMERIVTNWSDHYGLKATFQLE